MKTDSAVRPVRLPVVWNDSSGVSEKQLRFRQSFQSARPMSGRPCGPRLREHVVERALEVLEERRRVLRVVVERHRLLQDAEVARLLDVGGRARDEPQRVVVEAPADVVVPALRERLVLVVGAPVVLLRRRDVEDALLRARGDEVDEAEEVLVRVAEAHAAADAGLEVGGRARHVERDHALVRVPDVDHPVEPGVLRLHVVGREHARPVVVQRAESLVDLRRLREAGDRLLGPLLVDDARLLPLLLDRVLDVPEHEHERLRLAGREVDRELVRADRRPPARHRVARLAFRHHLRLAEAVPEAEEALAVGVEALHLRVHRVERVVVAALAVLGLVVDRAALDLDLADREVALVVRLVVRGVPEAELDEREELHALLLLRAVGERDAVDLGVRPERDEVEDLGLEALPPAGDLRVREADAALVEVELALHRRPAGRPVVAAVVDVVVAAADVGRDVVVAVARQPPQPGVAVEAVAAAGVRDEAEELLGAEVVDPGVGRPRRLDDVLAGGIVEVAEAHESSGRR